MIRIISMLLPTFMYFRKNGWVQWTYIICLISHCYISSVFLANVEIYHIVLLNLNINPIYIYIYMCVCVCKFLWLLSAHISLKLARMMICSWISSPYRFQICHPCLSKFHRFSWPTLRTLISTSQASTNLQYIHIWIYLRISSAHIALKCPPMMIWAFRRVHTHVNPFFRALVLHIYSYFNRCWWYRHTIYTACYEHIFVVTDISRFFHNNVNSFRCCDWCRGWTNDFLYGWSNLMLFSF